MNQAEIRHLAESLIDELPKMKILRKYSWKQVMHIWWNALGLTRSGLVESNSMMMIGRMHPTGRVRIYWALR